MASSGSYDFTVTRDNLITDALLYINAIGEGETPSATLVTEASRVLNMIVKLREAEGMPAWALKRGTILPVSDTSSINTNSHVVTFYASTTISADEASGQTSISITSGTDIADGDQIGIEQDDGSMHWTTVSSGGGTTTVVIAAALTDDAAAGNRVYAYTASADRIQKPLRIIEANILTVSDNTSYEIDVIERSEYFNLSNRSDDGTPNSIYYTILPSSDIALETNGQIFVYPRFENGDKVIEFTYQRPFQDFDASSDNPDFPQPFHLALMLELASLLGPRVNMPYKEQQAIAVLAEMYREQALESVYEEGSYYIRPEDA